MSNPHRLPPMLIYAIIASGVSTISGLLFAAIYDPKHPWPSWFIATMVLAIVLGAAGGIALGKWDKR
jgi:ABC-type Mn2+/Zn2+ transport system permease subunit